MAVRIVTYDLKVKNQDNTELREAIEEGYESFHLQESVWLIDTSKSSISVRDDLKRHLRQGDKLFVARIGKSWASYNAGKEAADWLESDERTWGSDE